MIAKVIKSFSPLSKEWGFSAETFKDSAWSTTEKGAVAKLLFRHKGEKIAVEWVNGGTTVFDERGEG